MRIQHFEYFIAIVEHETFTKAADVLHIAQPSLTAAIKKLEATLGYQLLERSTKVSKITDEGIQFYHYAKDIVAHYYKTVDMMFDLNVSTTPKIKLAILESTNQWVSDVIASHLKACDEQRYQITEVHDLNDTIKQIIDHEIDFGLTNEQIVHDAIESVPLYEEAYVLLTPYSFESNTTTLENLPLILPNNQYQVRKHLNDYFNYRNIRPNIVIEVDRFESACNYVRLNLGYAVIPQVYYRSNNTINLKSVHITPNLKRMIYINFHKKRKHSERVLSLIDAFIHYWNIN